MPVCLATAMSFDDTTQCRKQDLRDLGPSGRGARWPVCLATAMSFDDTMQCRKRDLRDLGPSGRGARWPARQLRCSL
jgi:hypothetical protein